MPVSIIQFMIISPTPERELIRLSFLLQRHNKIKIGPS